MLDYINAHRKAILAALGAVLVLIVDEETAQTVIAAVDALLVLLVPNDQGAVERVYHRR